MLLTCSRALLIAVLVSVLATRSAGAHHSRSNYDMQKFLEYDGTVVEFQWSNPHVFAVIEILHEKAQPTRLLLEMNSKIILSGTPGHFMGPVSRVLTDGMKCRPLAT